MKEQTEECVLRRDIINNLVMVSLHGRQHIYHLHITPMLTTVSHTRRRETPCTARAFCSLIGQGAVQAELLSRIATATPPLSKLQNKVTHFQNCVCVCAALTHTSLHTHAHAQTHTHKQTRLYVDDHRSQKRLWAPWSWI